MQQTITDIFNKGGYSSLALLICSLIAFTIIFEKTFWGAKLSNAIPQNLFKELSKLIEEKKYNEASGLLSERRASFAKIALALISYKKSSSINLDTAFEYQKLKDIALSIGKSEAENLNKRISILNIIANISPLIGLLGTVLGMIKTFEVINAQGLGNPEALSSGISEALISTALGLVIAIFCLVFYKIFKHKTAVVIAKLESETDKLILALSQ